MQEKQYEELTEEEIYEIMLKACDILEEHPDYVKLKKGIFSCIPDAPYEVKIYVLAQNEVYNMLYGNK